MTKMIVTKTFGMWLGRANGLNVRSNNYIMASLITSTREHFEGT